MDTERIAVIGAGEMGSGIAQKFAMQGRLVDLVDRTGDILDRSLNRIRGNLKTLVEGEYLSAEQANRVLPRVRPVSDLRVAKDSRFVLESVTENLELKQKLLRQLEEICPSETVLATNTSSLSISRIAAATRKPERIIGCHWVNPPYLIPLVEVVRGDDTSQETVDYCVGLLRAVGVEPAVCRKDVPGFVINRLQRVLQNEILDLVERGIVSLEDADNIVWLGLGARLALHGPLKINDLVADKTLSLHGFEYMYRETGDPRFKPSALLKEKVVQGALGIKSGKGWYDYSGKSFEQMKRDRDLGFVKIIRFLRSEGFYPQQPQDSGVPSPNPRPRDTDLDVKES